MHAKLLQQCPVLCNPLDCSWPGSFVHEILQARILEWVACPPPGDLPDPGIEPLSPTAPALQADSLPLVLIDYYNMWFTQQREFLGTSELYHWVLNFSLIPKCSFVLVPRIFNFFFLLCFHLYLFLHVIQKFREILNCIWKGTTSFVNISCLFLRVYEIGYTMKEWIFKTTLKKDLQVLARCAHKKEIQ